MAKPPIPKENDVQRWIVNYLDSVLRPSHRVHAIPNAAKRIRGGKAVNAVPGLRKGVPDLLIAGDGRAFYIEVKRPSKASKLRDEQEEWANWCMTRGNMPWACVRSVDEMRVALAHWGIPTREASE